MQSSKGKQGEMRAFFSDQCKEIEENNRMGKPRDLFKKIRDTKGTFHASSVQSLSCVQLFATPWTAEMGTINGRNGMDLTEAEDIKKSWQEYIECRTKKILMTQITTMV